jgi:hypothetical protein
MVNSECKVWRCKNWGMQNCWQTLPTLGKQWMQSLEMQNLGTKQDLIWFEDSSTGLCWCSNRAACQSRAMPAPGTYEGRPHLTRSLQSKRSRRLLPVQPLTALFRLDDDEASNADCRPRTPSAGLGGQQTCGRSSGRLRCPLGTLQARQWMDLRPAAAS